MCTDLCQCICFLYQQTLPAEVLSACSCTLLNKVQTLTSGVQLNEALTKYSFIIIAPKPQLNTIKPLCKRAHIKHSLSVWVCETFPIHRGRLLKRITWQYGLYFNSHTWIPLYSLIPATPYFIICLTGIRVVLERGSVAKATAAGEIEKGELNGEGRGKEEDKQ